MSGESTSRSPSGNRDAIATALSAVKTLSVENGTPLKKRALALVEDAANHEVGALLYDIARAHMLENEQLATEAAWFYENQALEQLEDTLSTVSSRQKELTHLSPSSVSNGEPMALASRLLDMAEERCGVRSATCSARSALEATGGNIDRAVELAEEARELATTRQHRDAAQRNLVRALLIGGRAERALQGANDAINEFGPTRNHLYNRLCAHALVGDLESFKSDAALMSQTKDNDADGKPTSWSKLVRSQLPLLSRQLKLEQNQVLAHFELEQLS